MTRALRDSKGRFRGSTGDGAPRPPLTLPASAVSADDEFPVSLGEVADLTSLYDGWQARLEVATQDESRTGLSPNSREEYADSGVRNLAELAAALRSPARDSTVPGAKVLIDNWEHLQPHVVLAGEALDSLDYSIATRLRREGITDILDSSTGTVINVLGGTRHSGWRHEELHAAVARAISADEEHFGTPASHTVRILDEYSSYCAPSHYRTARLESLGIDPADYSTSHTDAARLAIKTSEQAQPGPNAVVLASHASRLVPLFEETLRLIPQTCQHINGLSSEDAARAYARVRQDFTTARAAHNALKEVATRQLDMRGETSLTSGRGTTYELAPGRVTRRVDVASARPFVLHAISRDLGLPPRTVERVIARYEHVVSTAPYRLKALEAKTDVDVSTVVSKSSTSPRLVKAESNNRQGARDGE